MSEFGPTGGLQDGALATAMVAFEGTDDAELTIQADDVVRVLETETPDSNGWILVERIADGQSGFVPTSYLVEIHPSPTMSSFSVQQFNTTLPAASTTQSPVLPSAGISRQSSHNPFDRLDDQDDTQNARPGVVVQPHQSQSESGQPLQHTALPPRPVSDISRTTNPAMSTNPATTLNFPPAWIARDAKFQFMLPRPPVRRWYYRDAANRVQGPHDPQEMFALFSSNAITGMVGLQVGTGALASIEERSLVQVYPNLATAFRQAPVLPGAWYYLESTNQDGATEEHGPFSPAQMRVWTQQGCFARYSQVRSADGLSPYTMLSAIFPDPQLAFVETTSASSLWPPQQQQQKQQKQFVSDLWLI
jgi:hypothetical protein